MKQYNGKFNFPSSMTEVTPMKIDEFSRIWDETEAKQRIRGKIDGSLGVYYFTVDENGPFEADLPPATSK